MTIQITVNSNAVKEVEKKLGVMAKKAPNAISSALNRTVTNINSNAKKEVRAKYHVKAKEIAESLGIKRANANNLSAHVISKGKVIGLNKFRVNPMTANPKRKQQLKISIKKNSTKQILGAFVANAHGIKIFKRENKKRLPIERLMGPSIPQTIGNKEVVTKIERQGQETYERRITHEINHILSKL